MPATKQTKIKTKKTRLSTKEIIKPVYQDKKNKSPKKLINDRPRREDEEPPTLKKHTDYLSKALYGIDELKINPDDIADFWSAEGPDLRYNLQDASDEIIGSFFEAINEDYKQGKTNRYFFRQGDKSGLMFDIDAYFDEDTPQITDKHLKAICEVVSDFIFFNFVEVERFKIFITRRQRQNECLIKSVKHGFFKDGYHIIISEIQTEQLIKWWMLEQLTASVDEILSDLDLKNAPGDEVLDTHSYHVPVMPLGSTKFSNKDAFYTLEKVFDVKKTPTGQISLLADDIKDIEPVELELNKWGCEKITNKKRYVLTKIAKGLFRNWEAQHQNKAQDWARYIEKYQPDKQLCELMIQAEAKQIKSPKTIMKSSPIGLIMKHVLNEMLAAFRSDIGKQWRRVISCVKGIYEGMYGQIDISLGKPYYKDLFLGILDSFSQRSQNKYVDFDDVRVNWDSVDAGGHFELLRAMGFRDCRDKEVRREFYRLYALIVPKGVKLNLTADKNELTADKLLYFEDFTKMVSEEVTFELVETWAKQVFRRVIGQGAGPIILVKNMKYDYETKSEEVEWIETDAMKLSQTLARECFILNPKYNPAMPESDKNKKYAYTTLAKAVAKILSGKKLVEANKTDWIPYLNDPPKLKSIINTWQGFKWQHFEEKKQDADLIKKTPKFKNSIWHRHIREIIAGGNENEADYLEKWIAHIIQKPDDKTDVVINLYSEKQGTGKNIFFDFLSKVIGEQYTLIYADSKSFNGSFNGEKANKLLIMRDEMDNKAGNHQKFKSEVTAKKQLINEKYKQRRMGKDRCNYITATNDKNSGHVEGSDRRNAMYSVSEAKVGDTQYFGELGEYMNNKVYLKRAFEYFANLKVDRKDLRQIPDNKHRQEAKKKSASNYIRFVEALIQDPEAVLVDECKFEKDDFEKWKHININKDKEDEVTAVKMKMTHVKAAYKSWYAMNCGGKSPGDIGKYLPTEFEKIGLVPKLISFDREKKRQRGYEFNIKNLITRIENNNGYKPVIIKKPDDSGDDTDYDSDDDTDYDSDALDTLMGEI